MKVQMTPRDRSLLRLVLCAAVLLIGVRFLIMPALDRRSELVQELESARLTQMEYQTQIAALGRLDADIGSAQAELSAAAAPYYAGVLGTPQMDDIITALELRHGLFPQELTLTDAAAGAVRSYLADENAAQAVPAGVVYIGTAQLRAQGSESDFVAFLTDVERSAPGIRVVRFSISETTYLSDGSETVQTNDIRCTMELYMCADGEETDE